MPRAHLSKRLDDATAIQLFAEHHIVHVRRRKNGEIVAVKHSTFGWISPQQYYLLQKAHDLMPLLQEFIRGGYQAKAWLWSLNVELFGFAIPIGATLPVIETLNLVEELGKPKKDFTMIVIRAFALLGPFGDVIQIADTLFGIANLLGGKDAQGQAALPGQTHDATCQLYHDEIQKIKAQGGNPQHYLDTAKNVYGCDTTGW